MLQSTVMLRTTLAETNSHVDIIENALLNPTPCEAHATNSIDLANSTAFASGMQAVVEEDWCFAESQFERLLNTRTRPTDYFWFTVSKLAVASTDDVHNLFRDEGGTDYWAGLAEYAYVDRRIELSEVSSDLALLNGDISERGYFWIQRIMRRAARFEDAVELLQLALEEYPDSTTLMIEMVELQVDTGTNVSSIEKYMVRLEQLIPDDPEIILLKARVATANGNLEEAIASYHELIALEPEHIYASIYVAQLYEQTGDSDRAEAFYRNAVELSPEHANANWQLGTFLIRYADTPESAEPYFRRSVEVAGDNLTYRRSLFEALLAQQQCDQAEEVFVTVGEMDVAMSQALNTCRLNQ